MDKTRKEIILFNDSHSNSPLSKNPPQGGPSSFAKNFSEHFRKKFKDVELVSLLFTHNNENKKIYTRKTIYKNNKYYEVIYPRELLINSYNKKYSKKEYLSFLKPWIRVIQKIFNEINPDKVFLNGFSLSNWMFFHVAYKNCVPTFIQHAGIWKKEINMSKKHFSPQIKRIFNSFEKELFLKSNYQIFLNEFSKNFLSKIHNIKKENKKYNQNRKIIIPLPIKISAAKKISIPTKKSYKIGVVARWDSIKNHAAIYRLASYIEKNNLPFEISVVTKWGPKIISNFKDKYIKKIKIIEPMDPEKLNSFYLDQDIIIIPSRFDVSPTVLMEATLLGKPVIISNKVGWVSDYTKLDLNDMILNSGDSGQKIFESIKKLINKKSKYLPKFNLLQKKILKIHNSEIVFDEYYKIFKTLNKAYEK